MNDTGGLRCPTLGDGVIALRPWEIADAPALVEAWHDDAVLAGSTPPPDRSVHAARRWIEGWDRRRELNLALDLVITDPTEPSAVLGEVGIAVTTQRDGNADDVALGAMGWWVGAMHRRRGLATRAVGVMARWACTDGPFDALVAEIATENEASRRVAAAAGFEPTGSATDGGEPLWLLRRPAGVFPR